VVLKQEVADVNVDQVRGAGRSDRAKDGRQDVLEVPQRGGRKQKEAPNHVSGDWHDLRALSSGVPGYRTVPAAELAWVKEERFAPTYVLVLDGVKVPPDSRGREVGRDQQRKKRRE
jgi:hypothetical protein